MEKKNLIDALMILMVAGLVLLSACDMPGPGGQTGNLTETGGVSGQVKLDPGTYPETDLDISKDVKTLSFSSVDELNDFIKNSQGSSSYYGGVSYYATRNVALESVDGGVAMDTALAAAPMAEAAGSKSSDNDFSETNVQVAGIDEADILKTDGDYIYTVTGKVLYIIKAYPGEDAEIVSTIKFDGTPKGLFVKDDKLMVFGDFYDNQFFKRIDFTPRSGMTFVDIYDITDRNEPELTRQLKFEGSYFRGREKDGYAYILTSTTPYYRPVRPMPVIVDGDVVKTVPVNDIYYFDIPYKNPVFINIHALEIDDPDNMESKSVAVEYGQELYMSHDNIYITYSEYISEWELQQDILVQLLEPYVTDSDKELISKIKATDNDVLSVAEKKQKIVSIYMSYEQTLTSDELEELQDTAEEMLQEKLEELEHLEYTVINRVSYDKTDIEPEANGKVPGRLNNQFSMDEYEGVFRIATTLSARWSSYAKERTESSNNVYTLNQDLEIMDELEGLAEGETIYSTRFMGDRLYMVTYRQVDPFFVIDLSNPKNIKELGKLKIPGFSRYLHPYDENTIIGIGQDATSTGRTKGLKISLFDVSDVENPVEIASYVSDDRYAQSSAMWEHKAFLFSREKNLLVIPVYNYDYSDASNSYNGAFVFDIDKDHIELRGLIDHSMASATRYYYQPSVERSLYIEELLYTKSPNLLRNNQLDSLEKVKNIELREIGGDIKVY